MLLKLLLQWSVLELLTVGAVGVAEKRVVAPTAVGKDESGWTRWLLVLLLLLGSRWQSRRVL
jgi:hypothetical protein